MARRRRIDPRPASLRGDIQGGRTVNDTATPAGRCWNLESVENGPGDNER